MNKILFFLLTYLLLNDAFAQLSRHIVYFKHKAATTHSLTNPAAYLSQRAIERRIRYAISIDSTDLLVPTSYISQVQAIPDITVLNVSRWLNAVTIQTDDPAAIAAVNALPFVRNSAAVAGRNAVSPKNKLTADTYTKISSNDTINEVNWIADRIGRITNFEGRLGVDGFVQSLGRTIPHQLGKGKTED